MLRVAKRGVMLLVMAASFAATAAGETNWVTSWAASVQGPYPVGNPSAQPNLSFAFPSAETGARDQSFRLVVPVFIKAFFRFLDFLLVRGLVGEREHYQQRYDKVHLRLH